MSPYLLSNSHHLDHLRDRVYADDMRAREDGGRARGGGPPIALVCGAPTHRLAQVRLTRRPDEDGSIERRSELRQPRQHTITVGRPFGKPHAWIDDDPRDRHTGVGGEAKAAAQLTN